MPVSTRKPPSVAISAAAWKNAVSLTPPREQSALQEHRLRSMIGSALEAHIDQPADELIAFEFFREMPQHKPATKLQLVLQVIDSPTQPTAILISLPAEHA